MQISRAGSFGGVKRPPLVVGNYYAPHWAVWNNAPITLTANRLYRTWVFFDDPNTLAGGWFYNSGAADSGKNVRMGLWDSSGVLKKDFGAVALTGASALRSLANSVAVVPGWYQIGLVSDSTPALYGMGGSYLVSGAGNLVPPVTQGFGNITTPLVSSTTSNNWPIGAYAAFTYGAMPDPITAATATIYDAGTATAIPLMGFYL
jgi:hypothetical protein